MELVKQNNLKKEPGLIDNLAKKIADPSQSADHLNSPINAMAYTDLVSQFTLLVSYVASGFMIFGGVVPYMPQYRIINRSRNAQGFSTLVCLALLVANILRILFWFGHPFELPLLTQSVIMIACMLVMLELCIRVKNENANLLPQTKRRFTDFDREYFWKWTDFSSYIEFLVSFVVIGGFLTKVLIDSVIFVEFLGFASVFTEAMLAAPQFYRNYVNKSTEGMSIVMVLMWTSGDIFKTTYFILRDSPTQFWLCGMLQVSLDVSVLSQVYMYAQNTAASQKKAHVLK